MIKVIVKIKDISNFTLCYINISKDYLKEIQQAFDGERNYNDSEIGFNGFIYKGESL